MSEKMFCLETSAASVKLVELPVVMAPVHSSFFILPNFSDVFPLLPTDIDYILQRKVIVVINRYCWLCYSNLKQ